MEEVVYNKYQAASRICDSSSESLLQATLQNSTGDIVKLEKIQHSATKIAHSMKALTYNKRLEILNLTTLETRRTRGDLTQKFKDISKIDEIN